MLKNESKRKKYIERGLPPLCYESKVFDPPREERGKRRKAEEAKRQEMRGMEECIVTTKI